MTAGTSPYVESQQYLEAISRGMQDAFKRVEAEYVRGRPDGTRDIGPVGGPGMGPAAGMGTLAPAVPQPVGLVSPEVQERFLPLLTALLPAVVSAVPSIIQTIQSANRDIVTPSTQPDDIERDFMSVLSAVTPQIINSIPQIISMFSNRRDLPENDEQLATRWFGPLIAAVAPHLISAVPPLVSALAGRRRDLATRTADPEVASRFFGPLAGALLPHLTHCLPQIVSMFTGRSYVPRPS